MKEALLTPPSPPLSRKVSPSSLSCSPPPPAPYSLATRLKPLLLPLLSSILGALVLLQAISFFFLYERLEAVRIKLDRESSETSRREAFILREVSLLKGQMLALTDDYTHQGNRQQHFLQNQSPPYPPPPSSSPLRSAQPVAPSDLPAPEKDSKHSGSRRSRGRTKRRASDTSYGVPGGAADGQNEELSVQLQGEDSENRSEADQSWLQLTSYARIPDKTIDKTTYHAIQEFCSQTKASCPPGPPGLTGPPGPSGREGQDGSMGDRGLPGEKGYRGPTGLPGAPGIQGPRGVKGEIGMPGMPGLDGRDGLPGEPGLDGIPGRHGFDGMPGLDGIPGLDGNPGRDGVDGTDGRPGEKGERGLRGPQGMRGIAGPRGRKGKDGTPGTSGTPGISTWIVNGTATKELLVPPALAGTNRTRSRRRRPLVVYEGDNLRLRCKASGKPHPWIEWSKDDGSVIPMGRWKDSSITDQILNLTHINREHTGTYRCEAINGIPPSAEKTFIVEVHFNPNIRVNRWKVGTYNGSSAKLECQVESFPMALTYWEDQVGRLLDNSTKYKIAYEQNLNFAWKSTMVLEISNIEGADFGDYYCIAKNELSVTRGLVELHEVDPTLHIPSTGTVETVTFGPNPPPFVDLFDNLCPKCKECKKCPEGIGSLYGLRIKKFGNDTYPFFKNRTIDCELSAVGKPVYHRHTDSNYGAWMRDPHPRDPHQEPKYWTTSPNDTFHLYEFSDKNRYRKNLPTKKYALSKPFAGNSHVIYNGSFYYHAKGYQTIVKYDLSSTDTKEVHVPLVATSGDNYLYNISNDYIDFSTDENGLWAIYGILINETSNRNTVVMKIDPWSLKVEYSWNISISHQKFGELFITCGVLYAVDSTTKTDTKIRFALDLYRERFLDVDLPFNNPFHMTTMLGYNPNTKEIYSWDGGNQLTYPIKYNDIGYNTPPEERGGPEASPHFMQYNDYEVDPLADS